MAKFKYVGDPRDNFSGPDINDDYGVRMKKGEVVDVPDDAAEKMSNSSHFVDMSDKEAVQDVSEQQKAVEAAEKARAKQEEDQRKADEKDEAERQKNFEAATVKRRGRPPTKRADEKDTRATAPGGAKPAGAAPIAVQHTKAGTTGAKPVKA